MTHPPIRTAVFPVAGLGTRFLPATKASPKEMLVVVDKPLIQYAVEEARDSGIENFIVAQATDRFTKGVPHRSAAGPLRRARKV